MTGLGDTTAMLKRLRRQAGVTAAPAGRMTETRDFGANPGALRMLTYAPENLAADAPLVVVLHGCSQRAEAYAQGAGWLTLADRLGFVVLAPEQGAANNLNRCFNWFEPGDTARDQGEAASIRAMVAHVTQARALNAGQVFVTGLSAGGAMTAVMLAAYPEVFAAGAVVAGLPYGVAGGVQAALRAMHGGAGQSGAELGALLAAAAPAGGPVPRLSVWHGTADATVRSSNAQAIAQQWASAHGLADTPDETQSLKGRSRAVWRATPDGEALIELHLIDGLGHGTPLAAQGPDGLGATAPYLLEAGVSSSLEIARFWGLAPAAAAVEKPRRPAQPARPAQLAQSVLDPRPQAPTHPVGDQVMASLAGHVPGGVQQVIAKALRAAGLLR